MIKWSQSLHLELKQSERSTIIHTFSPNKIQGMTFKIMKANPLLKGKGPFWATFDICDLVDKYK